MNRISGRPALKAVVYRRKDLSSLLDAIQPTHRTLAYYGLTQDKAFD